MRELEESGFLGKLTDLDLSPQMHGSRFALVGAAVAFIVQPTLAAELTPMQGRLIALLAYIQVSRDHCGFLIDVALLRRTAADAGITFEPPGQVSARDESFTDAERKFVGLRRSVECAYALERFGPEGAEIPGLIARRPQSTQ